MGDDLLDHRLHLVHLDGVDHVVLSLVVVLVGCLLEAAPRLFDSVVEDVGEAQQHGSRDIAQRQFVHHLAQVNLRVVLAGCDVDVAFLVNTEVACAPAVDVVELTGIFNGPFLHVGLFDNRCKITIFLLNIQIIRKKRHFSPVPLHANSQFHINL